MDKLPQAKLRDVLGQTITIEKVISGNSSFGPYVLLITKDKSIISSGMVVMKQAIELDLPATVAVREIEGKNGRTYFSLE